MKNSKRIKEMSIVALFIGQIVVSTFIRIPLPMGNYITLQVEIVLLCGFVAGAKLAFFSTLTYALLGLMGLPVFAGGGGFDYVLRPSFGFILGFIVAATLTGYFAYKTTLTLKKALLLSLLSLFIIYSIGYLYQCIIYHFYLKESLSSLKELILSMLLIEIPKDIILCVGCSFIAPRLQKSYLKQFSK